MDKKLISILISGLFVSAPAFAQSGDSAVQGSVSVGGIGVSKSDTKDAFKLQEYRDLGGGALGGFDVRARPGNNGWVDAYGENIGREDMYIGIRGGMYDMFKARVYTDWLKHNFEFGALTPFAGAGTATQTATFPKPDPSTWFRTDIGYKRHDTGGYFEWQSLSPWYVRVDANQVRSSGSKLGAAANGTSPGNGYTDFALPVQYKTTNVGVEGGYNTKTMHFDVSWMHSKFDNDNETMTWNNPFFGNAVDRVWLPPDNKFERFAANGSIRQLPMASTLAARFTWSKATSDASLATTTLNTAGSGAPTLTNPDVGTYNGKIENTSFTLALASAPMKMLDTRVYYNYLKRKNDSTEVTYNSTVVTCGGSPCENLLYDYKKHNVGFDAYYRVDGGHKFGVGWDYWNVDRNREDYDHTKDNKFFAEYKNTMLDSLTARLKYTYLQRRSDSLLANAGANGGDPNFLERFVGRFDVANLNQNQVKLTVDYSPMKIVDMSLEALYKNNDYKDYLLGRTNDRRTEIYGSVSFGDPASVRATLFGDVETIKYDGFHRFISTTPCNAATGPNCFDPSSAPNASAYNWSTANKDKNYSVGAGIDWPVMDRLMVKGSFLYVKTDGTADMASQSNFGNPLPIQAYDSSDKTSFNLKGIYRIDKNWGVTLGYSYERYGYSDDRFNGYKYTIPFPGVTNNTSQSYLNGYNAFTPYDANIFYGVVTYSFN
jgi:MtrB/PioB family decaheme-associated outer membrane protein